MEQLFAIIHKEQGLIIKIAQDAIFNEDSSMLLMDMPGTNIYETSPQISLLDSAIAQTVFLVKFDYDSTNKLVSGYYDEQGTVQEMSFTLDETNKFLLDNNSLYWRNNTIVTS